MLAIINHPLWRKKEDRWVLAIIAGRSMSSASMRVA
jgi:hypothetical protein